MHHAARRREVPASGPRHHDHRRHLIAPSARRGSLLPVSHHCRPGACKRRSRAAEHAKIGARTAAAAKIHRGSSICRRLRRPALPAPRSLPHQIPIDGKPSAEPPRVPSLKAFGHRPSAPDDRSSNGPVSETLPADFEMDFRLAPSRPLRRLGRSMGLRQKSRMAMRAGSGPKVDLQQPE